MKSSVKKMIQMVNGMVAQAPQPPIKEGGTIIKKIGKIYAYGYKRKKRH